MRPLLYKSLVLLAALTLLITLNGCSGQKPGSPVPGGTRKNPTTQSPTLSKAGVVGDQWTAWAGPPTLGPAKSLPDLWCIELTHCYKTGYGYIIRITSKGEWYDETIRPKETTKAKGKLTAEEFAIVKEAIGEVNWELLPEKSTKDYINYTSFENTHRTNRLYRFYFRLLPRSGIHNCIIAFPVRKKESPVHCCTGLSF